MLEKKNLAKRCQEFMKAKLKGFKTHRSKDCPFQSGSSAHGRQFHVLALREMFLPAPNQVISSHQSQSVSAVTALVRGGAWCCMVGINSTARQNTLLLGLHMLSLRWQKTFPWPEGSDPAPDNSLWSPLISGNISDLFSRTDLI